MNNVVIPNVFPALETNRLILREITEQDTEAIFKNYSDPEVAKWFFEHPLSDIEQAREFVRAFKAEFVQGGGLTWVIEHKQLSACIGTCSCALLESGDRVEMGFDLAKEHWNKGLMSEALSSIIEYGIDTLGLSTIEAHAYSTNARALRLLSKLGFKLVKVTEQDHFFVMERQRWLTSQE